MPDLENADLLPGLPSSFSELQAELDARFGREPIWPSNAVEILHTYMVWRETGRIIEPSGYRCDD